MFKTTGKSTRCTYSQGLNLYEFQISRTLVDAQGVIQQPVCLNMARTSVLSSQLTSNFIRWLSTARITWFCIFIVTFLIFVYLVVLQA